MRETIREVQMSTAPAFVAQPDDPALLRFDGPIATITLNRPAAFNAINLAIAKRLEALAAEVAANDAIRVLVIEGEGRAFCAGGDLQTIGAAAANDTIAPVVGELLRHYHAFITTLRHMPKLVLSSVHGSAAGAGMSLAFIADLCIATEDARFTPAYNKLGVSPDGGGTVGVAYDWGLVARVVPAAELKAATREFALRLAQTAPSGIAATKALIHQAPRTAIEQQLDAERDGIIDCMHTDEFKAAVKKFTSKGK
jgi:enoyl-CoA hydratase/carnithine racemase